MRSDDPAAAHVQELIDGFCQDLGDRRFALTDAGVILLIERLLPDRFTDIPDHRRFARADLTMMGYGGQERSEGEMFTLLDSAGLRLVRIVGQAWTLSVVEVWAA
jgi:hypothetical protein